MSALGDFDPGQVIYGKFTTYRADTGAPATLAGTPVLSVYKDNSTTQSVTGVTLTVDFDSVTGLNHFAIDTSADATFYSAGSNFDIVITTGTVNSVSVVGADAANFTLGRAFAANGGLDQGTAQSVTSTTLVLRSAASFGDNAVAGAALQIVSATTGAGQTASVKSNVGSTDTLTVDPWPITPTGTIVYKLWAAPPGPVTPPSVNVTQIAGQTASAAAGVTFPSSIASPTNITAGTITTVTNLTNAPTAGDLTATMKTSVTTAATSSLNTALTEAYRADGATGSVAQLLYEAIAHLGESSISGTTKTIHKVDGSTSAATFTLDSGTSPTSITRAS